MESKIIKIGNSKGVILPAKLLNKLEGVSTRVEIEESNEGILIKPIKDSRGDWEEKIKREFAKNGPSEMLFPAVFEEEKFEEITW